jgi:hypothetical protein
VQTTDVTGSLAAAQFLACPLADADERASAKTDDQWRADKSLDPSLELYSVEQLSVATIEHVKRLTASGDNSVAW